jgi:PAS domain S-box-containing protein
MDLPRVSDDRVRLSVLSKISTLAGSLDPGRVLSQIAHLCVPELADWSLVDQLDGERVNRIDIVYRHPDMAAAAEHLRRLPAFWPHDPSVADRIRHGQSVVLHEIADEMDTPGVRGYPFAPGEFELLRTIAPRSELFVPLVVQDKTVAVLVAATTSESGRRYDERDLALAEEVARRAAQLVESAQLHQQLQLNENRFRLAIDHSNVVIFEQELDGTLRWVYNPLLGFTPEELTGKRLQDLPNLKLTPPISDARDRAIATGRRVRSELKIERDDLVYELLIDTDAVRDETGRVTGFLGAATDITDERRTREALAEALEFRERILGILGHDLRSPLTTLRLSAQQLGLRTIDDSAQVQVARILAASQRMGELIETLLDFAHSRFQGALPVSLKPARLADIVSRVTDEVGASHPDRRIIAAIEGDPGGNWDAARLFQLICNLVLNALRYGAPSAPVIIRGKRDGDQAIVEIHNDGSPISPELMPVLFEPFRRGESGGLGLGLYIALQIARSHGGTLGVESTARDGTTFTLRLPAQRLE